MIWRSWRSKYTRLLRQGRLRTLPIDLRASLAFLRAFTTLVPGEHPVIAEAMLDGVEMALETTWTGQRRLINELRDSREIIKQLELENELLSRKNQAALAVLLQLFLTSNNEFYSKILYSYTVHLYCYFFIQHDFFQ